MDAIKLSGVSSSWQLVLLLMLSRYLIRKLSRYRLSSGVSDASGFALLLLLAQTMQQEIQAPEVFLLPSG